MPPIGFPQSPPEYPQVPASLSTDSDDDDDDKDGNDNDDGVADSDATWVPS